MRSIVVDTHPAAERLSKVTFEDEPREVEHAGQRIHVGEIVKARHVNAGLFQTGEILPGRVPGQPVFVFPKRGIHLSLLDFAPRGERRSTRHTSKLYFVCGDRWLQFKSWSKRKEKTKTKWMFQYLLFINSRSPE